MFAHQPCAGVVPIKNKSRLYCHSVDPAITLTLSGLCQTGAFVQQCCHQKKNNNRRGGPGWLFQAELEPSVESTSLQGFWLSFLPLSLRHPRRGCPLWGLKAKLTSETTYSVVSLLGDTPWTELPFNLAKKVMSKISAAKNRQVDCGFRSQKPYSAYFETKACGL